MLDISTDDKMCILKHIHDNLSDEYDFTFEFKKVADSLVMKEDAVRIIYDDMKGRDLFSDFEIHHRAYAITPKMKFFDFIKFGGYLGEELLLTSNLDKLIYELEALQKPENKNLKIDKALSITANIVTILSGFGLMRSK